MPNRPLVVIPTYNERDNLAWLLPEVRATMPSAAVLVVDDGSPDGTQDIVRAFAAKDPAVHLLPREKKQGLGRAYRAGFRWGIDHGFDALLQMDADFSHQPRFVPAMFAALEDNDLAVGSRYIPAGGTEGWSLRRRILSGGGNLYARTVLGVPCHDMTGGFNCWRASALHAIRFETTGSVGYSFQVELKFRAFLRGLRVQEVPIVFPDRRYGTSKMSANIVKEAALGVLALRLTAPGAMEAPFPSESPDKDEETSRVGLSDAISGSSA